MYLDHRLIDLLNQFSGAAPEVSLGGNRLKSNVSSSSFWRKCGQEGEKRWRELTRVIDNSTRSRCYLPINHHFVDFIQANQKGRIPKSGEVPTHTFMTRRESRQKKRCSGMPNRTWPRPKGFLRSRPVKTPDNFFFGKRTHSPPPPEISLRCPILPPGSDFSPDLCSSGRSTSGRHVRCMEPHQKYGVEDS